VRVARAVAWAGWLALGSAALLALGCSVPGADSMFFSSAQLSDPAAADCERCHQEVYREWRASGHSRAWHGEAFQRASAQGRAEACTGCHAPAPVDESDPVAMRSTHLDEGVTCLSCHLSTQPGVPPLTMRGPATRTSPIEIHPIVAEDPFYRSSELCGRCHELELSQWREAKAPEGEDKRTCQQCHMPSVRRKVESVHDEHAYSAIFVAMGREQDLRRHGFAVPEDVADWLELAIERRAGAARIRVANRMPHALPTGAFGRRRIRVVASWPGGSATRDVAGGSADPLPAGATREIEVALPRGAAPDDLHVRLERWDRKEATWATLLEDRPERG
jgi:hypothetical protein